MEIKSNQMKKDNKKGFASFVILAIIVLVVVKSCSSEKMENVTLKHSQSQIIIVNESSEIYTDVSVLINDKYKAKFDELPSNGTYTIGLMLFSDKDGNRYNMTMKTHKVYISSKNSKEDSASALFELD